MTPPRTLSVRAYGTGWYHAAYSAELPVGTVLPLRYFGHDIVAFRTDDGQPHLLEAHCPHMGAHLGYGGEVRGGNIMCPYHNWEWRGSDGLNAAIPGLDRTIRKSVSTWRVHESDGIIYLWFSRTGDEEPTWLPPTLDESTDPSYYPLYPHGVKRTTVTFPPQFAFENVADISHLRTVHGWADVPALNGGGPVGPMFFTDFTGLVSTRKGPVTTRIENYQWGLGLVYSRLHGLHPTAQISSITPIDHESSVYALSIFVRRVAGDAGDEPAGRAKAVIEEQARQALDDDSKDRRIWDHQIYIDNAPLVGDERMTIGAFRRWARQFREDFAPVSPVASATPLSSCRAFPLALSEFKMEEYVSA